MFSHLSKRELTLYSGSVVVGLALLISGIVGNAQFNAREQLAGSTIFITTATSTTAGGSGALQGGVATTSNTAFDTVLPLAVTMRAIRGACNSGAIIVSWNTTGTDLMFRLYRNGLKLYEGSEQSYIDMGLAPGVGNAYVLYARAVNATYEMTSVYEFAPGTCEEPASSDPSAQPVGGNVDTVQIFGATTTSPRPTPLQGVAPDGGAPQPALTPTYVAPAPGTTVPTPVPAPVVVPPPKPQDTAPVPATIQGGSTPPPVPTPVVETRERTISIASSTPVRDITPVQLSSTTEAKVVKLFNVVSVFDETDKTRRAARAELVTFIDVQIQSALSTLNLNDRIAHAAEFEQLRTTLITHIDEYLSTDATTEANKALLVRDIIAGLAPLSSYGVTIDDTTVRGRVDSSVASLVVASDAQTLALKEQGGDLLYKDSNKDGISDYESIHVYNIDPVKPSPVSVYQGRKITAGEKVALGFDPTQTKLVAIEPEEPDQSSAPVAKSYTVSTVELTADKKLALSGRALPNSYVTLYIYSTPVIVTVKTNTDGSWKYTLTTELSDGSHKVSVATVDNSGKILAKSSPIPFTKTAQAATLDSTSSDITIQNTAPSLFSGRTLYMLLMVCVGIIFFTLGIMGLNTRRRVEEFTPPVVPL